jgi:2-polyprenyl-6-methoxyphenol hydroxylase-like FAD-dependent oxidoreductase
MAFEDAYVLARWLLAKADDPPAALVGYEAARKPRATKVQQLSRTEVHFKKQHSTWERLARHLGYLEPGFVHLTPPPAKISTS